MRRISMSFWGSLLVLGMFAGVGARAAVAAQLDTASKEAAAGARQNTTPAQQPSTAVALKPYTSAEGRFSVAMPGVPKVDSSAINLNADPPGQTTTIYHFIVTTDDGNVGYMVSYNDYSEAMVNGHPELMLKNAHDGAVSGSTVLTDSTIVLQGIPGRAFSYRDTDGATFDERQFFLGVRLYQLIVYTGKGFTAKDRDAFFNSFVIDGNPDMQPFTSDAGRFSILLPGAPKSDATPQAIGGDNSGLSTTLYSFSVSADNDNVAYLVCYNDYPPGVADDGPTPVLQRVRDAVVAQNTVLNDTVIDLNGVTGRKFAYRTPDGTTFEDRDFFVDRRLYQLIVVTSSGYTAKDDDAFMNSFAITGGK